MASVELLMQHPTATVARATGDVDYGIVLGAPRSGTTFLMRALTALPDAECLIGTLLPVAIPQVVRQDLPEEIYDALAVGFERALDAYLHSGRFHSRAAVVQKWFNAPTGLTGLLRALRTTRQVKQFIYKEPFLSFAPEFVDRALPEARIIHIYRDGRDVANSLVRSYDVLSDDNLTHLRGSEMRLGRKYDLRYVPWWVEEGRDSEFIAGTPYVRASWMWKYMLRRWHEFYSELSAKERQRVLLLRYEDFVRDPLAYADPIAEHLGLEPSAAFYRRLKRAHAQSIGNYTRRDPGEVEVAERIAGPELALYGYI